MISAPRALALLLALAGAGSVQAQVQTLKKIPIKKKRPPGQAPAAAQKVQPDTKKNEPAYGHYFIAALFNTANEVKYKGTVNISGASLPMTATDHSSSAAGFSGGYIYRRPSGLGWSAGATGELPRHSSGITGTAGSATVRGTYSGNMSLSLFTVSAGANYSFGSDFYVFGGANYPMVLSTAETNGLSGLPGYQAGVGYAFSAAWVGELGYRVDRFKGSVDSPPYHIELSEASFPGLILSVQYQF
jgi:hypothetical protein